MGKLKGLREGTIVNNVENAELQ